jgi:trimethylamine:corrinoid methyltransferase-like protein
LIREGVELGTFAGVDDTVDRFREFFWFPDMFRHWNLGRWRAEGSPEHLDQAWKRAQDTITESTHELNDDQKREIASIYLKAEEYTRTA